MLILGPVENEIGSGMTGGELFVFDPKTEAAGEAARARAWRSIDCAHVDYEWMHPLIISTIARTGSRQAEWILKNWADVRRGRRLRKVLPLAVARKDGRLRGGRHERGVMMDSMSVFGYSECRNLGNCSPHW